MPKNIDYDLYCPVCGKKAATANSMFIKYSLARLELPVFLCSECRTICIDKLIIRRIISKWRKADKVSPVGKMPFNPLCREFIGELAKSLREHWVPRLGYRRARFLKRPN